MSELLALGLGLDEVVATVTANPAKMLGMEEENRDPRAGARGRT